MPSQDDDTSGLRRTVKRFVPAPARREVRRLVLDPIRSRGPLVPEDELRQAFCAALGLLQSGDEQADLGDYVEFGVCRGNSMACMAEASEQLGLSDMRLIGFDSFEGMPAGVQHEDEGIWSPGDFSNSEQRARRLLHRRGVSADRVVLVKGWFDDTATPATAERLGIARVSLAMIDCDVYSSTRTALRFLAPLLAERCVLFFDDWNSEGLGAKGLGERKAFDEWLAEHPEFTVAGEIPRYADNAEIVVLSRTGR